MKKRIGTQAWKGSEGEQAVCGLHSQPRASHSWKVDRSFCLEPRLQCLLVILNISREEILQMNGFQGVKYLKVKYFLNFFPRICAFSKAQFNSDQTPKRWTDQEETSALDRATTEGPSKHRDTVQTLCIHNLCDGQILSINHIRPHGASTTNSSVSGIISPSDSDLSSTIGRFKFRSISVFLFSLHKVKTKSWVSYFGGKYLTD